MLRFSAILAAVACATCVSSVRAQMSIGDRTTIEFATVEEGKQVLSARDEYIERLSPFDRAARMKTDRDVSEAEFREFIGQHVVDWDDAERRRITAAMKGVQAELTKLDLPLPEKILLIKTTGNEEGRAAYTRSNAIVFPATDLQDPPARIQYKFCHELFHVLSRANPELREKLYASIGFIKCDEVEFPPSLRSRKITNPDAPRNDYCIRVTVDGAEHYGVPILLSSQEKYDVQRGGEFFQYLQFRFLLVDAPGSAEEQKGAADEEPRIVGMRDISGFFEQLGRNTQYIIHPEEILADNFAHLVQHSPNLPSPEVVERLKGILKERAATDVNLGR